jgi:hypothetical protein
MGQLNRHKPVKLIIGLIFQEEAALKQASACFKAEAILAHKFGKIDFSSPTLAFRHTDYYENEFGKNLKRRFISFSKLISIEKLAEIKNTTNKVEFRLSRNNRRLVNIDPGYLDLSKLILATTKDYKHRIGLGKGIYAEVTLFYQDKTFKPWEWTYRDYQTPEYISIFNQIREIYAAQIK